MNKVELIGHIGKGGIALKEVRDEKCVANFSLATNEIYNRGNENERKVTDWHRIVAWNDLAQQAEKQFKQGSFVKITGSLKTNRFSEGDRKKTVTYVLAKSIEKKGKGEAQQEGDEPVRDNG
ncbi:single-stranded DNA-binding protein [bacterium AH-315-M05]|nr:single-stranded DNA-binding protein [bacterium AH-315-M05]